MTTLNDDYTPDGFRCQVPKDLKGTLRADSLVQYFLPSLSRRLREDLFNQGSVLINRRPVAKGYKALPGDWLEIKGSLPKSPFPVPFSSPRPIVHFEDQYLLIVEKPGRIPTHPLTPLETGTFSNTLIFYWPQILGVGDKPLEPGLVHRLDKGTSGLLAIALNTKAWKKLKLDLQAKRWEKIYLVLVEGNFSQTSVFSVSLAHDPADSRKMKGIQNKEEKHRGRIYRAVTQIHPLKIFRKYTLVEARLITGVTHQIRVHLSIQGHPIVGDSLYGSKNGPALGLPSDRFFLHAARLSLPHPISRKIISCSSELPKDLQGVLRRLS